MLIIDGENFKSSGIQIVEHRNKENDSKYRTILLTDVAKEILRRARELNPDDEFIFKKIVSDYCKPIESRRIAIRIWDIL